MTRNVVKSTRNPENYNRTAYKLRKEQAAILAAEGLSNKEIAQKMGLTQQTVDRYKLVREGYGFPTERITLYIPIKVVNTLRNTAWAENKTLNALIREILQKGVGL